MNPSPSTYFSQPASQDLTSPLFLHAPLTFLLPSPSLLHFLMLPAFVEVLHHNTHKHVEDKEADDEEEGDKIEQHPWVVVGDGLEEEKEKDR